MFLKKYKSLSFCVCLASMVIFASQVGASACEDGYSYASDEEDKENTPQKNSAQNQEKAWLDLGVSKKQVYDMQFTDHMLEQTPEERLFFSPGKRKMGARGDGAQVNTPEHKRRATELNNTYKDKRQTKGQSDTAAIKAGLSRETTNKAKKSGLLFESTPQDFKAVIWPETDDEKAERLKLHSDIMASLTTYVATKEEVPFVDKEEALWQNYCLCTQKAREHYTNHPTQRKMRETALEGFFNTLIAPYYKKFIIEGFIVFYHPDSIDLALKNSDGDTNSDLMKKGKCPLAQENEAGESPILAPMNFHHLTHHDPSNSKKEDCYLVVVTHYLHTEFSGDLHMTNSFYHLPETLHRPSFETSRKDMCKALEKHIKPT